MFQAAVSSKNRAGKTGRFFWLSVIGGLNRAVTVSTSKKWAGVGNQRVSRYNFSCGRLNSCFARFQVRLRYLNTIPDREHRERHNILHNFLRVTHALLELVSRRQHHSPTQIRIFFFRASYHRHSCRRKRDEGASRMSNHRNHKADVMRQSAAPPAEPHADGYLPP